MPCRTELMKITLFLLSGHHKLDIALGRSFQEADEAGAFSLSQHLWKYFVKEIQSIHFPHSCQLNTIPSLTFRNLPFCGACLVFISVSVRDPGLKLLEVQMTSGFSAPPEYWLQCLSVHYSSKLMMQSTTCCLQLSVRVERSWQKCLVFCEQHVINSLGACSLYVDDYSLWYVFVYFWVLCITSCAIFFLSFLDTSPDRTEGEAFCAIGVKSNKLFAQSLQMRVREEKDFS